MLKRWLASFKRRRVPVLLQLSAIECGAACLAMVLSYWGRATSVAEAREVCRPSRDGLSAQTIAAAGRHYGLIVRAFALQNLDFGSLQLPAILHWNFNHFVVLEQWSPRGATIVDPALGRRFVELSELDQRFTGIVLSCQPGPNFEQRQRSNTNQWRLIRSTLLAKPSLLVQIIVASGLLQLVGLALPLLTKSLVQQVTLPSFEVLLGRVLIGLGLIISIRFLIQYMRSLLLIQLQLRFDTDLSEHFLSHLLRLPLAFFEQRSSGDLLLRLTSNSTIRELITNQVLSVVLDGGLMLVYGGLLFWQSGSFGLTVAIIALLQVAIIWLTQGRLRPLVETDLLEQSEAQSYLVELLSGITTIKAMGVEHYAFGYWQNLARRQRNTSLRRQRLSAVVDSILGTLQTATPLILLWVGLREVHQGQMDLSTMLALNAIGTLALAPLVTLISQGQRLQLLTSYLERLNDVLMAQPEPDGSFAPETNLQGAIRLENVSFGYNPHTAPILRDISLQIAPGQKVALVGRTGSGKSTLAKLLLGLYQPSSGQIWIDERPIEDYDRQALRQQFGVVLQDAFLFSGSIRQNINLQRASLPAAQLIAASQRAGLHNDIVSMPMGYETRVGEAAGGISGGQRQRIALARALLRQPAILILDEATSQLDTLTEQIVEQQLNQLNCTRIVIAHRLSTVKNADVIIVLDRGQIAEQGTHGELVGANGVYASMVSNQQPT
ncbi:MAG: peptidase domain-containing ABC transporter [Chloroflexi bacterium]|nr:peptidase domain-containing ABC transporter [Chloroflexota bacterium]